MNWITVKEGARRLGVTTQTLYTWMNEGYLPYLRVGKVRRLDPDDVELLIDRTKYRGEKGVRAIRAVHEEKENYTT